MKTNILKLLVLTLLFSIANSCSDPILDSNMWSSIHILLYDNEDNILRGTEISAEVNDYLKSLKIKVTSDDYKETIEVMYIDADKDRIKLPLKLNTNYFSDNLPELNSKHEIFEYTLLQDDEIIFDNKFKVKYKEGNPFEIITEMSNLNSNGKWEKYTPKRNEIIINDKATGVFFSVRATF